VWDHPHVTALAPVSALCGVVVGSIVTFVGQSLTRRQTSALSIAQQKADLRRDRRDAIHRLLEVAATIYEIAETRNEGDKVEIDHRIRAAQQQLEFRRRCIDLICRPELSSATDEYTTKLSSILVEGVPREANLYEYAEPEEKNFYDVAREELYAPKVSD
jgi:hypothetical protein